MLWRVEIRMAWQGWANCATTVDCGQPQCELPSPFLPPSHRHPTPDSLKTHHQHSLHPSHHPERPHHQSMVGGSRRTDVPASSDDR